MSKSELERFRDFCIQSPEATKQISESTSFEDLAKIAKQNGFTLTASDFEGTEIELADSQLEGVAGGGYSATCAGAACKTSNSGCLLSKSACGK